MTAAVGLFHRILYHLSLVQLLLWCQTSSICSSSSSSSSISRVDAYSVPPSEVVIRPATSVDVKEAQKVLFREKMNPLSVSETTMLIAVEKGGSSSDGNNNMIGFGQIRRLDDDYSELASLYVYPQYRHQGVGSKIVSALLSRHDDQKPQAAETVCLLTLKPTIPFYKRHGFDVVSGQDERRELPSSLQVEYFLGSIISKILNNELVCMVRRKPEES